MKYVFFSIILLISLIVINNLLRSIVSLSQKQDLISHAQKQLDKEKKENQALKQQLQYVNNKQFVEEQARNKLFMAKDGEQIVILPQAQQAASSEAVPTPTGEPSVLTLWYRVFFTNEEQ